MGLLLPLPEGAAWGGPQEAARLSGAILAALQPFRRASEPAPEPSAFKLVRMSPGWPTPVLQHDSAGQVHGTALSCATCSCVSSMR
jgi:hypothetical protein